MGLSSLCLAFASMFILSKLMLFYLVVANSLQSYTPTCHDDEISALMQFKLSFVTNMSASGYEGAHPKTASWKSIGDLHNNCCSWDGIKCDEETGHVIGLDLSSSYLYGSINSNNSLFRLVHLQSLNLADNNFRGSHVPTSIGNFPRLRYLNLSRAYFSGQVPSQVSQLIKLSSLDLSAHYSDQMFSNKGFLRSLARNLTGLEKLHLSSINISSTVPDTLANLSNLASLLIDGCGLFGTFPAKLFNLQNLKVLSVSSNSLTGYFPDDHYNGTSPDLMSLKLSSTDFFLNLSSLIKKFESLKELDVAECNISEGPVPFSLINLRHLIYLDLSNNRFNGQIPPWLGNLTQLTYLGLSDNNFRGFIPSSFRNLTQLTELRLSSNHLTGPVPACLGYLTQLTELALDYNNFHGSFLESLFNLINLQILWLNNNNLSGTVEFHMFHKLQKLTSLDLSSNKLEVLIESRIMNNATTLPKFEVLGLGTCNIREFPNFLRYQQTMWWLNLSGNKLHGGVPKWIWNICTQSQETLFMNLSHNFLSGFHHAPPVLAGVTIAILDLSFNMLRGSLLIPLDIRYYIISNNELTGEVSPLICNMTSLEYLDLSNNELSGMLPQCVKHFGDLEYLNLGNNSFHGILPQAYTKGRMLRMIDVSHNHFNGQVPRSLTNSAQLEGLVFSHNEFSDVFPFWLGTLPDLKILAMDHNEFYGVIGKPMKKLLFPGLCILDLSYNSFSGEFPFEYILSGNGTRRHTHELKYYISFIDNYYSIRITSKGVERYYYPKVQADLVVIDISSNNFEGKIPEILGELKGLWSLNVSSNILTGCIPSSLGNLTYLESLDLSNNKLSGMIPQQLGQLFFLAKFNVSHNNLSGPVPGGTQFSTFDSTSYYGNPRLCGDQLPTKCGNSEIPDQLPPSRVEENDSETEGTEFCWKFILAGVVSGLVVGVVLADVAITRWPDWFSMIVGILIRQMKRRRDSGRLQ